jgi:hypothetical protein
MGPGASQCGAQNNTPNSTLGLKIISFTFGVPKISFVPVILLACVKKCPCFLILNLSSTNSYVNFDSN